MAKDNKKKVSSSFMDENFTDVEHDDDEFQELLDSLPGLSPVVAGKRGGGRKATNNIGADVLGFEMLKVLRTNHHVNLFGAGNLKGNTLWGVIDMESFQRANQVARGIEPSYSQKGILAISLSQTQENEVVVQWWKATIVNGVLSFQKVYRKGADYKLTKNNKGQFGIWKMDGDTGQPEAKNNGDYFSFPFSTLVDFEVYLNAIVTATEVPVSFPDGEVNKLRNLSEILANVNLNAPVQTTDNEELEDLEKDEVGA